MYFGRDNISATIHVPFACGHSCEFCTVKKMYAEHQPSIYGVLGAIETINKLNVPEVVISGGEPFTDLDFLDYMVTRLNKKIYINTCMPDSVSFEDLEKFLLSHTIRGINISRHDAGDGIIAPMENVADDDFIKEVADIASVRINCVLYNEFVNPAKVIERWEDSDVDISFRADYTKVTPETLHTLNGAPAVLFNSAFIGESHCEVCQTFRFKVDDKEIIYHKGLKQTRKDEQINDIIVYPDGQIALDWDAEPITESEMTELLAVGKKKKTTRPAATTTTPKYTPNANIPIGGYISSCGGSRGSCGITNHLPQNASRGVVSGAGCGSCGATGC